MKNEKRIFAQGFCFFKLFYFFLFGCLFGTYFEEILFFVQNHEWTCRAGVIYGPFSPLYGFGVLIFVLLLFSRNKERGVFFTFFLCTLIGGVSEYLASFLLDVFFHIRFWDYTGYFLNIHGRTTIPFMVVWGIFGTFLMKVIVPFLSKWVEKIPYRFGVIFTSFLVFFLSFDIILSFGAFVRFCERKKAHEPISFVGAFYDRVYPDDFLLQKFPILNGK